jgi:hypothetical protein
MIPINTIVQKLLRNIETEIQEDEIGPYVINNDGKQYLKLTLFNPKKPVKADFVERPDTTYYYWKVWRYSHSSIGDDYYESNLFYFNIQDAVAAMARLYPNRPTCVDTYRIRKVMPDGKAEEYQYQWNNGELLRIKIVKKYDPNKSFWPKFLQIVIPLIVMISGLAYLFKTK